MFKTLRIRLTVLNISVVAFILFLCISGTYLMMARNIAMQTDQMMRMAAQDAGQTPGPAARGPGGGRQRRFSNAFYVRINNKGDITDNSPNLPVSTEQLNALLDKAKPPAKPRGIAALGDGDSYRYLTVPQSKRQESVIVFLSTDSERETLTRLLATLTATGLIGLALVFFGSLFLAEKALVPIKKSWQKQKDFIADASHELRTPLAVVQTNLELVMGNPEETVESQTKWLENVKAENARMAKLVSDMLFIARSDSNQEQPQMNHFPLHTAVQEALKPLEPLAAASNVSLESSIDHEILFHGDEARIKQLIVILIDNAIKYTPPGGKVVLKLRDGSAGTEITVSDTGEGIEKEHLVKIFERFYRVDKARSRQGGGTGLGLSIAELIVKEHKGSINVSSQPGKGTTFQVVLPNTAAKAAKLSPGT